MYCCVQSTKQYKAIWVVMSAVILELKAFYSHQHNTVPELTPLAYEQSKLACVSHQATIATLLPKLESVELSQVSLHDADLDCIDAPLV